MNRWMELGIFLDPIPYVQGYSEEDAGVFLAQVSQNFMDAVSGDGYLLIAKDHHDGFVERPALIEQACEAHVDACVLSVLDQARRHPLGFQDRSAVNLMVGKTAKQVVEFLGFV